MPKLLVNFLKPKMNRGGTKVRSYVYALEDYSDDNDDSDDSDGKGDGTRGPFMCAECAKEDGPKKLALLFRAPSFTETLPPVIEGVSGEVATAAMEDTAD